MIFSRKSFAPPIVCSSIIGICPLRKSTKHIFVPVIRHFNVCHQCNNIIIDIWFKIWFIAAIQVRKVFTANICDSYIIEKILEISIFLSIDMHQLHNLVLHFLEHIATEEIHKLIVWFHFFPFFWFYHRR